MYTPAPAPAQAACARLRQAGHSVYLAGGAVRDRLLGRPVFDLDIATSATPDEVVLLFPDARLVGASFGVVLVQQGGEEIQIATFRSDHSYIDHRHPGSISFEKDPRQDVLRRDFTINGLLEDPLTGEILDFVGGRADLDAHIIRAIGDPQARFAEDALRMLRAVRLAARLGFTIESATLKAIQTTAYSIDSISAERIRDEISLIITSEATRQGFVWLRISGLLPLILPEVSAMEGVVQPPGFHPEGDVWTHTLLALDQLANPSIELALAVLLHDVAKPRTFTQTDRIRFDGHAELGASMAREILTRLRYPNSVIDSAVSLIANHMRFMEVDRMGQAAFKRLLRLPRFDDQLELLRIDTLASNRPLTTYELVRRRMEETPPESVHPPRLLGGDNLLAMGFAPGRAMGEILHAVEEAQLEGELQTRQDAERFVRTRFGVKPPSTA
ncbi:MAG TPA: CCA tRNA nucleotidyltransferase [Bryobacteraceae bacterium]|nr:CCA tRNA nucleotidyltransferase [Bryobacteraceae bacterium]HPT26342.1 CCA tRNA nucleotidyltransferase [Bryobacteraceae bacterium]